MLSVTETKIKPKKQIVHFNVGDMLPLGLTLVTAGIALAYGLQVMGDIRDDTCGTDGGFADAGACWTDGNFNVSFGTTKHFNATEDAITGVAKLPAKLPLIATVIVAAIVLGIVVRYLAFKN